MNRRRLAAVFLTFFVVAVVVPAATMALDLRSPKNEAVITTTSPDLSWTSASLAFVYEVSIWDAGSSALVYQSFPAGTSIKVESGKLRMGRRYIWMVKAKTSMAAPSVEESTRWSFNCGSADEGDDDHSGEFSKKGATLVIPVEFKSHKFSGDPVDVATRKMNEMKEYYRVVSYNAADAMSEVAFDVAPAVYLNVNRSRYSGDKKDSGGNWMRDCGDWGSSWQGAHQMKKAALPSVFKSDVPVSKYRHIIYIVPGSGGNSWGSDQFWPASTSGSPSGIRYSNRNGTVCGSYASGIVMAVGVSTGTYNHEFGHQLGLPDLYPYTNLPDRNLGYNALMASGNQVGSQGVSMYVLSRKRSYSGTGKKKNWIGGRLKTITQNKTIWLDSRTSKGEAVGLLIPAEDTYNNDDYYVVELFDRKRVDKDFVGYFKGPNGTASKANAAVFMSYVDDDDVQLIKVAHGLPKSKNRKQNFFLTGGEYKKGTMSIKVKEMRDMGDRWVAKIAISLDGLDVPDNAGEPKEGETDDIIEDPPDKPKFSFFGWIKDFFSRLFGLGSSSKSAEKKTSPCGFMLGWFNELEKCSK